MILDPINADIPLLWGIFILLSGAAFAVLMIKERKSK